MVTLKPDREEKLNELQTIRLVLPEDIERMKSQKKRENNFQERWEHINNGLSTWSIRCAVAAQHFSEFVVAES